MASLNLDRGQLSTEELILQLREAPIEQASVYCEELILRFEPLLRRAWQRETSGEYQDFVQDVFVRLFAGLPQLRNPKAFPGYFRSIVLSVVSHRWRKEGKELIRSDEDIEIITKAVDDPLITRIFIRSYVERLPAREKEVITLAFLRDLSTKEIARQLNLGTGAVRATKSRALNRLRALFLQDALSLENIKKK